MEALSAIIGPISDLFTTALNSGRDLFGYAAGRRDKVLDQNDRVLNLSAQNAEISQTIPIVAALALVLLLVLILFKPSK